MSNFTRSSVSIRQAGVPDIGAVVEMIGQLAEFHGDETTTDRFVVERDITGSVPWITVLVAEIGRDLVGYVILCPLYKAQFGQRGMDMHHLFVKRKWRRAGIGRKLVLAAIDFARLQQCSYFTVGTSPNNIEAQNFYKRQGFISMAKSGPKFRFQLTSE